ncbi:MAG: rod shape-determining protein [Acidobacteria bacterium]|nr:rod shape-determining protein [Acidobacteriota bacterium]
MVFQLSRIISSLNRDLAIDLGTANTLVFAKGLGIVVQEPSIVAIDRDTNTVRAVGIEAKKMLGRTPSHIIAIKPMRDGVIADFEKTEQMLNHFIKKAQRKSSFFNMFQSDVVIGVPAEITQVERRAVRDSAKKAGAANVYLIEEAMAAAIGAGLPVMEPTGNMIVDIGGGSTDVAVISLGGIVYSRTLKVAGNAMDEDIVQYIRRKYRLLIGERTAENIKTQIGSAFKLDTPIEMEIKGRSLETGIPKTLVVNDSEIREALSDTVNTIIETIKIALERTPPELAADLVDKGIVLTGGGSLLKGFDKRLREETNLPVGVAEEPLLSVVLGVGQTLSNKDMLEKVTRKE